MVDLPQIIPTPDPNNPFHERAHALALHLLEEPPPRADQTRFNWTLIQTRLLAKYVLTLAGAWRIWGDERFARRAWFLIEDAMSWTHWYHREWSWNKEAHFDLATGEMAVTFSAVAQWLEPWLNGAQREAMAGAVQRHVLQEYLKACPPKKPASDRAWWWKGENNWNSVCNGGAATAASIWSGLPESAAVTELAWEGLEVYLRVGVQEDGSSVEGIGYWQYGTIYLLHVLARWEHQHGCHHPALDRPAFREGFDFPFDFSPGRVAIGFCDSNHFEPAAALLPMLRRAGREDLIGETARRMLSRWAGREASDFDLSRDYHPDEILAALHLTRKDLDAPAVSIKPLRIYRNCGWVVMRESDATLSFLCGSTRVSHAMKELLAINLARGGAALLQGQENASYPAGWFNGPPDDTGRRASRPLFWEENSGSKNAPLASGIGQVCYADAFLEQDGPESVCADGTQAYPFFIERIVRRVACVKGGFMITDSWKSTAPCFFEARYVTPGSFDLLSAKSVRVTNAGQSVILEFDAGTAEVRVAVAEVQSSVPGLPPVRIIRGYVRALSKSTELRTMIRLS